MMEEYIALSDAFEKRLGNIPISREEERYLLFRMAGPAMQSKLQHFVDLTKVPKTFIHGNPHIDNYVRTFGGTAMMDFDRSRIGPYCWDIIRFLSSLSLRRDKEDGFLNHRVVENFIDSYAIHFSDPTVPSKQLKMLKQVEPEKWQLTTRDYLNLNKRWAKKMRDFALSPKDETAMGILRQFLELRNEANLLNDYFVSEIGLTPGSLGKQHYIYALIPKNKDSHLDAILLDIKEVYEEIDNTFFK